MSAHFYSGHSLITSPRNCGAYRFYKGSYYPTDLYFLDGVNSATRA
jgi:hypothetical protein